MQVIRNVHRASLASLNKEPVALTIGNFDGFHRGHCLLVEQVQQTAKALGVRSALLSFSPSPSHFFSKTSSKSVVMSWRDRLKWLQNKGIDRVHILHFDAQLAACRAESFLDQVLCERVQAHHIIVGDDFHFGYRREGSPEWLVQHAPQRGVGVTCVPAQLDGGRRISSSWIREALAKGDVETAIRLLGRPYQLRGRVRQGAQRGRTWGFPTLNLNPSQYPLIRGVFRVSVEIPGIDYPVAGIANVGQRPTLEEHNPPVSIEIHLLEEGSWNLYGYKVNVSFLEKCRDEQKFESFELLKQQIALDVQWAKMRFAQESS